MLCDGCHGDFFVRPELTRAVLECKKSTVVAAFDSCHDDLFVTHQ